MQCTCCICARMKQQCVQVSLIVASTGYPCPMYMLHAYMCTCCMCTYFKAAMCTSKSHIAATMHARAKQQYTNSQPLAAQACSQTVPENNFKRHNHGFIKINLYTIPAPLPSFQPPFHATPAVLSMQPSMSGQLFSTKK